MAMEVTSDISRVIILNDNASHDPADVSIHLTARPTLEGNYKATNVRHFDDTLSATSKEYAVIDMQPENVGTTFEFYVDKASCKELLIATAKALATLEAT